MIWAQTQSDIEHLKKIGDDLFNAAIQGKSVRIKLKDGGVVEGCARKQLFGNNGGKGGWKYNGSVDIETATGTGTQTYDYLEIDSITQL